MSEKVLIVDDDVDLLQGLRRQLRKAFALDVAEGGEAGLELMRSQGPYAVVISDMQMPGMTGVEFLGKASTQSPESVRLMLTGNADQQTAIDAVNDGKIFRFLNKPCSKEDLIQAIDAALEQHRLITAERELISKTLTGSVKVLTDVLSLTNPQAFSKSARVRRLLKQLLASVNVAQKWECEIAAMLAPLGYVTFPDALLSKLECGATLTSEERESVNHHPQVASALIANIPRLQGVARIVAYQGKQYNGAGFPEDTLLGDQIPIGARLLKLANDWDQLLITHADRHEAMEALVSRSGWYDPDLLTALRALIETEAEYAIREISFDQLGEGDELATSIEDDAGAVLVGKGQEVSASMLAKLQQFRMQRAIREPIRIVVKRPESTPRVAVGASV